jgi:hypothetical protein
MPRQRRARTTMEVPLDPLVPHLAAMLREAIVSRTVYLEVRKTVLWASWTLPLVCREARRLSEELIDELKWLWLFEAHLHMLHVPCWKGMGIYPEAMRACEGLPPWFDVREQAKLSVRPQLSHAYTRQNLGKQGNYEARVWYARHCTGMAPGPGKVQPAVANDEVEWRKQRFLCGTSSSFVYTADDLAVPKIVAQFVGFLRWLMDSSIERNENNVPHELFCSAPGCKRPACVRSPKTPAESDATYHLGSYWTLARCGVTQLRYDQQLPSNMLWCSYACEQAGMAEYVSCVRCCTDEELAAPMRRARSTRVDQGRVSAARLHEAALERNALVARRLRAQAKTPVQLRHYPMSAENLAWYHESLVDALNLDVGVLFAAVHIASWAPSQRPARVLPYLADWRDCVWPYMNAICNVRRVYVDHVNSKRDLTVPLTADDLHTNPSAPPKWMLALKNQFDTLF